MSNIRVTYSGGFFFMVGIITIFTGLAFMLIVTRSLSPQEFGTWNLIIGLILYVSLIQPLTSYWITREVARGEKSGKTAIISSSIFSLVGVVIFLIISFFTGENTDAKSEILFFAVILVPIWFLNDVLMSINMGFKPHIGSLGKLSLETSKIPLAITFVFFMDFGVQGVILSVALAHIPSIILLGYFAKEKISDSIKKEFLIKWINLSWVSLYPGINLLFRSLDVLIFSILTGSVIGLAYYGAAWSVSSLVAQSSTISTAVYPKLLSGGKTDYLQDNITKILYFAILFSAISITFARPGLYALNPLYEIAFPLVLIMTLRFILDTFNRSFENFLIGIEKVDQNAKSTFKNYATSKLFTIPTFRLIQNIVYMSLLVAIVLLLNSTHSEFELLIYWVILGLITSIPITIYLSILLSRNFDVKLDLNSSAKYLIACVIVFLPISFLTDAYLIYDERIIHFLPNLLLYVTLAIGGYLLLTYIIDNKTRVFFNAIFAEIKKYKI
jgi:O-antigen/teichoic acid export membrane protein